MKILYASEEEKITIDEQGNLSIAGGNGQMHDEEHKDEDESLVWKLKRSATTATLSSTSTNTTLKSAGRPSINLKSKPLASKALEGKKQKRDLLERPMTARRPTEKPSPPKAVRVCEEPVSSLHGQIMNMWDIWTDLSIIKGTKFIDIRRISIIKCERLRVNVYLIIIIFN